MSELDTIVVKRFAKLRNLSEEDAEKILKTMKEKKPDSFERISKVLGVLSEYGDKLEDPILMSLIAPLLQQEFGKSVDHDKKDDLSQWLDELVKKTAALRAIDRAFEKENETGGKGAIEELKEYLKELIENRKEKEMQETINAIVGSIKEEIKALADSIKEVVGNKPNETSLTTSLVKAVENEVNKSKKLLETLGYRVDRGLTVEEVKRAAEEMGLKVIDGRIPLEELNKLKKSWEEETKKLVKEAYMRGREDEKRLHDDKMYERQISAVERIVEKAVDRIVGEILGPLFQAYITAKTGTPPPPPPQETKVPVESAETGESSVEKSTEETT